MRYKTGKELAAEGIADLPLYDSAKSITEVMAEFGLSHIALMNANENPCGPSPMAVAAMREVLAGVNRYPDGSSLALRRKMANRLGITADMLMFANGGDNVINLVSKAFLGRGDRVVICDPSFSVYIIDALAAGAEVVKVPLKGHSSDLSAVLAAVKDTGAKMAIICNPNNPTGTLTSAEEIDRFMGAVPDDLVVVFDEAYMEFVDHDMRPDTMRYVHEGRPVIIIKTFSKYIGLAGMRIGYSIAPKHMTDILRRVVETFPVNVLAQAAAEAALDDADYQATVARSIKEGREYLERELSALGFGVVPSCTTFIFVDTGLPADMVYTELLKRGIMVRFSPSWGSTCLRISVGSAAENEALIAALAEIKG